eukprot:4528802-Lingulodinium_polyedra.AAC.1
MPQFERCGRQHCRCAQHDRVASVVSALASVPARCQQIFADNTPTRLRCAGHGVVHEASSGGKAPG